MRGGEHRTTMKKIYIGKTALKVSRNGAKHQKKSSLLEQKEDLRKRLSFTTHKLELLESEFDSTRQYLETELRRAQEELDKFTDKLRRIQSSYSALQRINQDLEEKIHRNTQHHDDEKRALSREIIVLNNHLIEAKLTIEKLQEDNELYRKDCNLAAQLLQCNKAVYRAQLSELPADLQQRVTLHLEESSLGHPSYADSVPGSVIAEALEKADEACSSSQASHSPSPPPQEHGFLMDTLGRVDRPRSGQVLGLGFGLRAAYKTDLYSSDTALYCPDERLRERRPSMDLHGQRKLLYGPQNSMDSNPEEAPVALRPGFSQEHFGGKFPGSSTYSSFSGPGSEDKGEGPPSSGGSSPHLHSLYMEWRDAGDYERKSNSSWERDSPGGFSIGAHPFQQAELSHHQHPHHQHHQNGSSPVYSRTMSSCFSEPYEPLPPSSSPSVAYGDSRRGSALAPGEAEEEEEEEEELIGRWRQLSVEDLSAAAYRSPGRASPYSFSEQHFSVRPSKIRLGPLYSSFQEGADYYPHQGAADSVWGGGGGGGGSGSPSSERGPVMMMGRQCHSAQAHLYRAKEDSQESENSLYHSGSSKDLEGSVGGAGAVGAGEEYTPASPTSSGESLNRGATLEMQAAELQHYQAEMQHNLPPQGSQTSPPPPPPPPPYSQKFGTLGLSRKDSLTKAQLYGTLLN
ncbi:brain-enriched guanylate kinase-associated protein isoform X1 [Gadus morhua]|uniref:Si:dkey-174m14.3 n=1 Tax=Gadus morhua TaxID=8049 RepID=A0A8C5AEV5_GADMO|nr:brain-enriched guanylate kinase-associated protein-like isoform X1 [Gadus morhua]